MKQTPFMQEYRKGNCTFAVQSDVLPLLKPVLQNFDETLKQSQLLKDSKTTTAGIMTLENGTQIFLKRTNNKGMKFTIRYLFRKARPYRAMRSAQLFEQLGIRTPAVFAAGEKRTLLYLHCGYMIQESNPGFSGVEKLVMTAEDPVQMLATEVFPYAAKAMAKLHNAHVIHGDLKLGNFFRDTQNGKFGIWDLDSVRLYNSEPPVRQFERELGRLLASCFMWLDKNPNVSDDFFHPKKRTNDFLAHYLPMLTTMAKPSAENVAYFARERWERMPNRTREIPLETETNAL